jgi:hypothetical protein
LRTKCGCAVPEQTVTCHASGATFLHIMAPPVSKELCKHVVVWYYDQNLSIQDIIHLSGRSQSTVYWILGLFDDYGEVFDLHALP